MAKFLRKSVAVLALLVVGACIVMFMLRPASSVGLVRIENQSGERIKDIEVDVCKNQFRFTDLPAGSVVAFTYPITSESAYKVTGKLASGKPLEANIGYVTKGFNFSDTFIVTGDDLVYKREEVVKP